MESGNIVSGADIGSDSKAGQVATPSESHRVSLSDSSSLSGDRVVRSGEHTAEAIPVSSMPNSGQSSDDSATPILPTPAVERPAGSSPSEGGSDRIPAFVFARTTTAGPMEWSVASNESLFSIQMGNMSFTREQLSWMSKSGELNYACDSTLSGPVPDIPSGNNQTVATLKPAEISTKSGNDQHGVTEAAAAETMREVLREKECQQKDDIPKESPHSRSVSQHSDASVKSFAFPILTGDADKCGPLTKSAKNKNQMSQPSTPKTAPQTPPAKTQSPPGTPKPQSPTGSPKQETPKSQTPKATTNVAPRRWFNCFSCCPPRS